MILDPEHVADDSLRCRRLSVSGYWIIVLWGGGLRIDYNPDMNGNRHLADLFNNHGYTMCFYFGPVVAEHPVMSGLIGPQLYSTIHHCLDQFC